MRGLMIEVVTPAKVYRVHSESQPGVIYTVARSVTDGDWCCNCAGAMYAGRCKHADEVRELEAGITVAARFAAEPDVLKAGVDLLLGRS